MITPIIKKIQIRTTEVTRTVVVDITTRLTRHQEATAKRNIFPSLEVESSWISKFFQTSYFKGYLQGCEEARRVNYANGYQDGYRNGKIIGRIQITGIFLVLSALNLIFRRLKTEQ
ncbi:MAG TPA: hypothetical protein VLE96_03830 [Chlamydiales bacterium]|nr:hypothetical protein [Chlamydiales bacterium]